MRVLITGGAGFIGSYLVETLMARGDEVTILDDLSTGRFANVERFEDDPKFHCVVDDVAHEAVVDQLVQKVDVIYHLAAAVGVQLIVDQPVRTIETNIRGTEVVLKHACRYRKRVLITSTSEVYGKSTQPKFKEDDDRIMGPTTKCRWAYAASKAIDEFLALAYWYEKRLPVVIVRLFNTVGPRQTGRYGMVVPRFVRQALQNEPLTVFGDGKQTRCFTYVGDVVPALVQLLECKRAEGEIFNIGSDEEVSIEQMARRVIQRTGSTSSIQYVPYAKAYGEGFEDMQRRVPDTSKARELIGFVPKFNLDQILDAVVTYERKALGLDK